MKKKRMVFSALTIFLVIFGFISGAFLAPASASSISALETSNNTITKLSEKDINLFDKYIESNNKGFYITDEGYKKLNKEEIQVIEDQLVATNESFAIDEFEKTGESFTNVVYDNEFFSGSESLNVNLRSYGKNKISFYWWGFKAYLSKGVVRAAGELGTDATIMIAKKLKVTNWIATVVYVAALGLFYSLSRAPHGIGVRYTYGVGTTGVWWQ